MAAGLARVLAVAALAPEREAVAATQPAAEPQGRALARPPEDSAMGIPSLTPGCAGSPFSQRTVRSHATRPIANSWEGGFDF